VRVPNFPSPISAGAVVARLRAVGCVFAEDEARLLIEAARTPAELERMVGRRAEGLPLEHVLGWAEFGGLRIAVDPGVFVPRRRTEFLAQQASARARAGGTVVELCCGTGAIGAVLLAGHDGIELQRPTSTPPRSRAPAGTSPPHTPTCTKATSTIRCRLHCPLGSGCSG
jgi:release factor glutamine methyltransferase